VLIPGGSTRPRPSGTFAGHVVDYSRIARIARRRAELGWRAAVLDEEASRHVFRLRATRGRQRLPGASLRERSKQSNAERAITRHYHLDAAQYLTGGHVDGLWLRSLLQRLLDGECCLGAETGHCGNLFDCRGTQLLE
jgi:hypothetical protein